jgi:hypothetical protein
VPDIFHAFADILFTKECSVKNSGHEEFLLGTSVKKAEENGYVRDAKEWYELLELYKTLHVG